MADPSFDIVSEVAMPEVVNAVAQAQKEVAQRFDLKGTAAGIELKEKENQIVLTANDDFGLKAVNDVLQGKLIKRSVHLKSLVYGTVEPAREGDRPAGRHDPAGDRDREGEGDRPGDQGRQAQGPGGDPGRAGAGLRKEAGRPAGRHRPAAGQGLRPAPAVLELPQLRAVSRRNEHPPRRTGRRVERDGKIRPGTG